MFESSKCRQKINLRKEPPSNRSRDRRDWEKSFYYFIIFGRTDSKTVYVLRLLESHDIIPWIS